MLWLKTPKTKNMQDLHGVLRFGALHGFRKITKSCIKINFTYTQVNMSGFYLPPPALQPSKGPIDPQNKSGK